ncbi:MAG: tetratricopeptide repeat protein, partial [Proteobacteria bacterium]|nr:tetratricopeptide repeat protein [Pseudomonadota bacterium]
MADSLDEQLKAAQRLHAERRFAEAEAAYGAVLQAAPREAAALAGVATLALQTGRNEQAAELFTRALAADPDRPNLHNNLGVALRRLKRGEAALAAYDRAISLRLDYAEAHNNRGNVLLDLKRPAEALESFDRALALRPDSIDWRRNRGLALLALDRLEDALASFDALVGLAPDFAPGHFGRGTALARLDRPEEAVAALDAAIALDPGYAAALNNRGEALSRLGRHEAAVASFDAGLAVAPDDPEIHDNRALALLSLGRFAEGWRDYEHRWRVAHFVDTSSGHMTAALRGRMAEGLESGDVRGKRILVVAEQGVGDVIMFASLLPDLMAEAGTVTLRCERRLHRLFATSFPGLALQTADEDLPTTAAFDLILPIGGLARL